MHAINKVAIRLTPAEASAISTLEDMFEDLANMTEANDLILNDDEDILFTKESVDEFHNLLNVLRSSTGWEIEKGAPTEKSSHPTRRQYKMTRTVTVDLTEEAIEAMKEMDEYYNSWEELRTNFDSDEELIAFLDEMYDDDALYKYVTYGTTSEITPK